jgi:hypothetical protein
MCRLLLPQYRRCWNTPTIQTQSVLVSFAISKPRIGKNSLQPKYSRNEITSHHNGEINSTRFRPVDFASIFTSLNKLGRGKSHPSHNTSTIVRNSKFRASSITFGSLLPETRKSIKSTKSTLINRHPCVINAG